MRSHEKHNLAVILSVLAMIATGIDVRLLIDHDNLTVSSLVSGKLVKLTFRFNSPNIKYFMLGEEKGIIYVDGFVDDGRAFGHLSVPREGYVEIGTKIKELERISESNAMDAGEAAYDFLKIDEIEVS